MSIKTIQASIETGELFLVNFYKMEVFQMNQVQLYLYCTILEDRLITGKMNSRAQVVVMPINVLKAFILL